HAGDDVASRLRPRGGARRSGLAAATVLRYRCRSGARRGEQVRECGSGLVQGRTRDVHLRDEQAVPVGRVFTRCGARRSRGHDREHDDLAHHRRAAAHAARCATEDATHVRTGVLRSHQPGVRWCADGGGGAGDAAAGWAAAGAQAPGQSAAGAQAAWARRERNPAHGRAANRRARGAAVGAAGSAAAIPRTAGAADPASAGATDVGRPAEPTSGPRIHQRAAARGGPGPDHGCAVHGEPLRGGDPEEVCARRGVHRVRALWCADRAALPAGRRRCRDRRAHRGLRALLRMPDRRRDAGEQTHHEPLLGHVGRQRDLHGGRTDLPAAGPAPRRWHAWRRRERNVGRAAAARHAAAAPHRRSRRHAGEGLVKLRIRPLDRYVLTEFWKIFVATALGFPLLTIIIDLTDHLNTYLNRNLGNGQIALSYLYWIPDSMFMVLPAAVLFATVFSIGSLTRHSEVTAAKASGISFHRMVAPIFLGAALAALFGLFLGELVPVTDAKRNAILEEHTFSTTDRFNFAFEGQRGRVYQISSLDVDRHYIDNLAISRKGNGPDYPTYLLAAQNAQWDTTTHKWTLRQGDLHIIPDSSHTFAVHFDSSRDNVFTEPPANLTLAPRSPD